MYRSLRNQIQRTAFRRIFPEIDFKIVIARYALILAATKAGNSFSVECADNGGNILASVVNGLRILMRCENRGEA